MAGKLYVVRGGAASNANCLLHSQNVHAIGDRANGIVLDAFESALKGTNLTSARPRLEHAQIMTKEDMHRLGELGGQSVCFLSFQINIDLFQ